MTLNCYLHQLLVRLGQQYDQSGLRHVNSEHSYRVQLTETLFSPRRVHGSPRGTTRSWLLASASNENIDVAQYVGHPPSQGLVGPQDFQLGEHTIQIKLPM